MEDIAKNSEPAKWKIFLLGLFHILWAVLCGYLIYEIWPLKGDFSDLSEKQVVYLVMLCGALGSFIHSAGSFITFVGDKKLNLTWLWWYILRPLIGMGIALVFFIVFKAGLLVNNNANVNPYGILALSVLTGMYSDRAALKLGELFETLFKPDDERGGKLKSTESKSQEVENPEIKG